jgi:hypothetical protein
VHLWDNNEEIVQWLTKQLDETSRNNSIVQENISGACSGTLSSAKSPPRST